MSVVWSHELQVTWKRYIHSRENDYAVRCLFFDPEGVVPLSPGLAEPWVTRYRPICPELSISLTGREYASLGIFTVNHTFGSFPNTVSLNP